MLNEHVNIIDSREFEAIGDIVLRRSDKRLRFFMNKKGVDGDNIRDELRDKLRGMGWGFDFGTRARKRGGATG
jgi:hypothetical protein